MDEAKTDGIVKKRGRDIQTNWNSALEEANTGFNELFDRLQGSYHLPQPTMKWRGSRWEK